MRALIMGGTGMLGSRIATFLLQRQNEVVVYHRRGSGTDVVAGAGELCGDRGDYAAFERQIAGAGFFDVVVDLVGYVPEDARSLVRAFRGRIRQLVFCSTVDVYAKPASRYPYTEDEEYGGLNDYSRTKVECERILRAAEQEGAFALTILRPAYTYAQGRCPLHPVSWGRYLARLREGRPIVVQGDGQSLWCCCHADDVARAFGNACGNPVAYQQAYHVAGEEWLTWDQYHLQVAAALGLPAPHLIHIPSDLLRRLGVPICAENFQFCNIFDNAKARRDLGFAYTVRWQDGVRRMADWQAEHPEALEDYTGNTLEDRILACWQKLCAQAVEEFNAHKS